MITTPNVPTLTDAKLLDTVFAEINAKLTAGLSWLDSTFGKAVKLYATEDGRNVTYPAIYTGNDNYLKLLPDSHIGSFSFFDVQDGQAVQWRQHLYNYVTAQIGLVVWFDYRDVYGANEDARTIENVKADVLRVLSDMYLSKGTISIEQVFEEKENVYPGYTINQIQNQFWMRPYGCLRFEGEIVYREICTP